MVLPASERAKKLRALLADEAKIVGSQKLFYKGAPRNFKVYEIDLDWLVYNRHNGRIESEMLTWEFDHDVGDQEYTTEVHNRIAQFLWDTNTERNRQTLRDIEVKQQQRPGIVSLDGVIIDGNRRAMLLNRISPRRSFEAAILPDEYHEDEKAIVRLETEYQIGEDAKLDYGPLEKYLKVKRLNKVLDYEIAEIADMMGEKEGEVKRLLGIMDLMDDYLAHLGTPNLYKLLKEQDGSTKEGMFVDLYQDLKRLNNGNTKIERPITPLDIMELQTIQFDHIRYGNSRDLFDGGKNYRQISHDGRGESTFFANDDIWSKFTEAHTSKVNPVRDEIGTLDEFVADNPDYSSRIEAAEARESEWKSKARDALKNNFRHSSIKLEVQLDADEPRKLLERALAALGRIDVQGPTLVGDPTNVDLVREINSIAWDMKKRFDQAERQ